MASNSRLRRAQTRPEVDASSLNNVERLIFSQAVYEVGSENWADVAKILTKHPMVLRPKTYFTAQTCPVIYVQLMKDAELECSDANAVPRAPVHLQLAQRHYNARLLELRELIAAEETIFKTLVTEIDEIRSGLWDDKIRASLGITPVEAVAEPPPVEEAIVDEPPAPSPPSPQVDASEATQDAEQATLEAQPEPIVDLDTSAQEIPIDSQETVNPDAPVLTPTSEAVEHEAPSHTEDAMDTSNSQEEPSQHEAEVAEKSQSSSPDEAMEEDSNVSVVEDVEETPDQSAVDMQIPSGESSTVLPDAESPEGASASEDVPPATVPAETVVEVAQPDEVMDNDSMVQDIKPEPTPTPEDEVVQTDVKRKASELEGSPSDSQREKKRARDDSEPADDEEAGTSSGPKGRRPGRPPATENPVVSKRFQNMIGMLHSQISQHRNGNIFHNPIRKVEAADYHDIVKRPMDLKTIKTRIKDGLISNSLEFQRDVYLMFANAMMYNRPGSEIYNMAEEMMLASEIHINTFRQTEGFHRM